MVRKGKGRSGGKGRGPKPLAPEVFPPVAPPVGPSWGKALLPFLIFLVFYGVYTAATWRDYPCHWDTAHVTECGARTYDYYFRGDKDGRAVHDELLFKDHDFLFAALMVLLTGMKGVPQEVYHLVSMVVALVLYGGAYLLFRRETGHPFWALAGPFALFLTPVLLGHIPANFMDAPNAGWFTLCLIAIYFTARLGTFSWARILVLGVAFGISVDLRISGLTLFPILALFDLLHVRGWEKEGWKSWSLKETGSLALIFALSHLVMVLLWPYLLHDYPRRLAGMVHASTNLPWSGGTHYFGGMISNLGLPWHYLPVWIGITSPLTFLVCALLGLLPRFRRPSDPWLTLCYLALAINLAAWVVMRPVVHSGIRHFLYLLPIVSLAGARVFLDHLRSLGAQERPPLGALVGRDLGLMSLAFMALTMVLIHPYQYLYYNELTGGFRGGFRTFEKDYWITANKEAAEWLAGYTKGRTGGGKARYKTFGSEWQGRHYAVPWTEHCDCPKGDWDYLIFSSFQGPLPEDYRSRVLHVVERMGEPLAWVVVNRPVEPLAEGSGVGAAR